MTDSGRRTVRFTLATLVTTSLLVVAGVPSVIAGSASDPEISDAARDVSPAAFATNATSDEQSLFDNVTAYDVVKAWIGAESATHFMLFVEVDDLPDAWGPAGEPPAESPFGQNASFAGTSLVANFSIAGRTYWAIAKLAYPGPDAGLLDNYTLWRDGEAWRTITGSYNVSTDRVQMTLPKANFLGLADNVRLEKFWVEGRFGDFAMDFAPNAKDPALPGIANPPDPLLLAELVAGGMVVEPQFGRDYVFGKYYHGGLGGGGQGGGAVAPALVLRVDGAAERSIQAGQGAKYEIYVENLALAQDTVYFTLSSPSAGWDHRIEAQSIILESGQARLLALDVSAASNAKGGMRSIVDASSQLGASKSVSVLSMIADAEGGPGASDDTELPVMPAPSSGGGSPGVAAVVVFCILSLIALMLRRRKA